MYISWKQNNRGVVEFQIHPSPLNLFYMYVYITLMSLQIILLIIKVGSKDSIIL